MPTIRHRPKKPPRFIYVLFDHEGDAAGMYETEREADDDAIGPTFRPTYRVRQYLLISRLKGKDDPRGKK